MYIYIYVYIYIYIYICITMKKWGMNKIIFWSTFSVFLFFFFLPKFQRLKNKV